MLIMVIGERETEQKESSAMTVEQIEEVLPGIYRLPIPLTGNPLKELNSYVFRGKDDGKKGKNLLVDTGFRREDCRRELLEGMALLGLSMEDTDILLTHLHADHSGNAADVVCPGNRVYIGRTDGRYLTSHQKEEGFKDYHDKVVNRMRKHGITEELLSRMYTTTPSRTMAGSSSFHGYTFLNEGEKLTVGEYTLTAIDTPGHTPGQMCFQIEGTGAMILGDHVLFDITPNITDWPGVTDSLGDYLRSLDKIDRYDVTIPLPGHRKPGDFHERIAAIKAHHDRRLKECLGIVRRLDHAHLYEIAGNMTWRIRADNWETFPDRQRWFALGECMAHLDHLVVTGEAVRHEENGVFWYEARE